jgi:hypothetical protein
VCWALEAAPVKEGEKAWVALFNGRDLTGWKKEGAASWKVEKGLLVGRQGPGGKDGNLLTVKEFDNFELQVVYKCDWPCNSGVWFRYQKPNLAYQADILEYKKPEAYSGTVYCPGIKELFLARNLDKKLEKRDGWNTFVIRCQGDHIVVHLNKKKVADFRNKRSNRGRIGYQVHAGEQFAKMAIYVKEAKIRLLKSEAK